MAKSNGAYLLFMVSILSVGGWLSTKTPHSGGAEASATVASSQIAEGPLPNYLMEMLRRASRVTVSIRFLEAKRNKQGNLCRADWESLVAARVQRAACAAHYNESIRITDGQIIDRLHLPPAISEGVK